ncbi:hypothetical protein CALVIDRAFT_331747 [Calocera viscosa TUFC12733]|uniref:Camp independent regulatory protein n=1 Tax=Calocera viscosa (strain TUFC12733) TaxID=1330018 RepID=A0A167HSS1_CALVF|nr:hypothetical protein CALVIDRAFT_331747 [Calocera viscosa TUFC12733]
MASIEPEQPANVIIQSHGPYSGWIDNTHDALLVYEAASRGIIPRITRRLSANERALIGSGTIFVYDERESGIKRWTDGYTWSPSRAQNNFFLYREVLSRAPNSPIKPTGTSDKTENDPAAPEALIDDQCCYSEEVRMAFEKDRNLEKTLVGSLRNSYPFKVGGMIKKVLQTISFCVKGVVSHHIVSYYTLEDIIAGRLIKVSDIPEIRNLEPSAIYMDNLDVLNFPPKTVKTDDGIVRYVSEADDIDKSRAGRPKDHPHVRAEEKAREHNFGFEDDETPGRRRADTSVSPMTYSRYQPYYRPKSSSSSVYSGEDEQISQMPMYYYPRGPGPSRRPGGHSQTNGYPGYPYPYDPYAAYHHWYAQQAAYYTPYPPGPYGYPYPYQSYYPEPRYAHRPSVEPRSPGRSSVEEAEKATEEQEDASANKGKKTLSVRAPELNRTDIEAPRTPEDSDEARPAALEAERAISNMEGKSLSPLTPPADDDESL